MHNLIFKEVVLDKSLAIDKSVMVLLKSELDINSSFSCFQRNIDYASGHTFILGGFIADELVCINAFMRMKFMYEKTHVTGYQSGFSATSSNHRGKGLWPMLMKFSEDFLTAQGASFIFGYPNPVSYPLFVKKLAYHSMDLHGLLLTRLPFLPQWDLNVHSANIVTNNHTGILRPDLADNIAWKQRESGVNCVHTYKFRQSLVWGKVRTTKKLGFRIRFFEIGGMELSSNVDLKELLKAAFTKADVLFCYIFLNQENEYFSLFKGTREKRSPVIIKVLGKFSIENMNLNFFGGMRDTY
jgi:hypothetical protein